MLTLEDDEEAVEDNEEAVEDSEELVEDNEEPLDDGDESDEKLDALDEDPSEDELVVATDESIADDEREADSEDEDACDESSSSPDEPPQPASNMLAINKPGQNSRRFVQVFFSGISKARDMFELLIRNSVTGSFTQPVVSKIFYAPDLFVVTVKSGDPSESGQAVL